LWFPKFNDPIHNNIPTDACEPDESLWHNVFTCV
jgi:hypothetical protein